MCFSKMSIFRFSCNGRLTSYINSETEAYKSGELQEVLEKASCS